MTESGAIQSLTTLQFCYVPNTFQVTFQVTLQRTLQVTRHLGRVASGPIPFGLKSRVASRLPGLRVKLG